MPDIGTFSPFPVGQAPPSEETDYGGSGVTLVYGVVVQGAGANVKGSWVQLVASTTKKTVAIVVSISKASVTALPFLVDIGIGAAASEAVLIGDLYYYEDTAAYVQGALAGPFLIEVPAGTRIAARCQCSTGSSRSLAVAVTLMEID